MKIANVGLALPEGKVKYQDPIFADLARKFQPAKLSPYYFEFLPDDFTAARAIALAADRVLDLLILDMEKVEARLSRAEDPAEQEVLRRCLAHLEEQQPICDLPLDSNERALVSALGPLSLKPTVVLAETSADPDEVCRAVLDKAGMMFFYTAGKEEVHAWLVEKGADSVSCAGRIHSDLARGFIKAELVSYEDMMTVHSMQDARLKGLTRLVDRDAAVPENTILEIRFNV
jgi:ribosome-binding ATPase